MSDEKSFHMTPDEFRRHGHAVIDWIADYQARVEIFSGALASEAGRDPRLASRQSARTRRAV